MNKNHFTDKSSLSNIHISISGSSADITGKKKSSKVEFKFYPSTWQITHVSY